MLEFRGSQSLRHRLVLSTLTGTSITIQRIRSESANPGLNDAEVVFLRLLSQLTNGTTVEINPAGTVLKYSPGLIINNPGPEPLFFDCGSGRALSYYVEGVLPLCLFGKNPLNLKLRGRSNDEVDVSLDSLAAVYTPLMKNLGVEDFHLAGFRRGVEDGEATLTLTPLRKLEQPVLLLDPGKVKRVRGTVYCSKGSPQMANRVAYSAKGALQQLLPDIWISTDFTKRGSQSLLGISLSAETSTGLVLAADAFRGEESLVEELETDVPEDLGYTVALRLLDEIFHGGCVDASLHWLPLLLMALGPKGRKGSVLLGRLTNHSIELLRLIQTFLHVTMELESAPNPADVDEKAEEEAGEEEEYEELADPLRQNFPSNVKVSCIGVGYQNMARVAF